MHMHMHTLRERQRHLSSESPSPPSPPSPRKEKCSFHSGLSVCRIVSLLKVCPPSRASSQKVSRSFLLWCSFQASWCSKRWPKGLWWWWSPFGDSGLSVISAAFRLLAPCRCTRTTPRPLSSHSSTRGGSSPDDCISAGGLAGGLGGGRAARCAAARCTSASVRALAAARAASTLASALSNFCEARFPCAVIPARALSISRKLS